MTPHFFPVGWANGTFSEKLGRLETLITELYKKDKQPVGIIGISAGASLALHAFVAKQDTVAGVVTICGKIQRPEVVRKKVKRQNPAFAESMARMPQTLAALSPTMRKRILCIYPLFDEIVAVRDQCLDGAQRRRVLSVGHVVTIAGQLLFGARKNAGFIMKQIKR